MLLETAAGVLVTAAVVVVGQFGFLEQVSKGQLTLAAPLQHVCTELVRSGSPSGWQTLPLPLRKPTLQHLPPSSNGNGKAHGQAVVKDNKLGGGAGAGAGPRINTCYLPHKALSDSGTTLTWWACSGRT